MTLSLDEFLRRFLLHLLPKGFVRIRHFGFLANRRRATLLPLCFHVLNAVQPSQTEPEVQKTRGGVEMPSREMEIDRGLFQIVMSQEQLNGAQVSAVFQ